MIWCIIAYVIIAGIVFGIISEIGFLFDFFDDKVETYFASFIWPITVAVMAAYFYFTFMAWIVRKVVNTWKQR